MNPEEISEGPPAPSPPASDRARSRGRQPWALLALTLTAIAACTVSALSFYRVRVLRSELSALRSEILRRTEGEHDGAAQQNAGKPEHGQGELSGSSSGPEPHPDEDSSKSQQVLQPCLQMIGDGSRSTTRRGTVILLGLITTICAVNRHRPTESDHNHHTRFLGKTDNLLTEEPINTQTKLSCAATVQDKAHFMCDYCRRAAADGYVALPWQAGLRRGTALQEEENGILVREGGFYFIYSQVYYTDKMFAMGHIILQKKQRVVGDGYREIALFRCIQNMNHDLPYNTCYTGGIVRLEAGDRLELLIPRKSANVSLDGDSTFFGAVRLA